MAQKIKGVGVDLGSLDRVSRMLNQYSDAVLSYLYSKNELDYCRRCDDPEKMFTICFSAKEAVGKSMGTGMRGILWREIEVIAQEDSRLCIELYGEALKLSRLKKISDFLGIWNMQNRLVQTVVIAYEESHVN